MPGRVFVLHPDELHDGRAGSEAGFRYRIIYIDPWLILGALGEARPLPFVREVVSANAALMAAIMPALSDLERRLDDLGHDHTILALADALTAAEESRDPPRLARPYWRAARIARELLDASIERGIASHELEAATGLTRYAVARHFRAAFGTSPYNYLVMRRLHRARFLIGTGASLADAALSCGFADQSHMSRQFKRAYGLSPGRWAALSRRHGGL